LDFLGVNQNKLMGISQLPEMIEFIIRPANAVLSDRNPVQFHGNGLPDQFLRADRRAAGVVVGVEVEVEKHHDESA
jgi:hypothetical protein